MAKKKQPEPIVGIGENPDILLVQKSRPLFGLWKSEFTLASFKLLDVYLARINSEAPDKRTVILEKGEIERVLGVTKIDKKYLDERLTNLFRPVELSRDEKGRIHKVSLFEEVMAEQDKDGIWRASLTCTPAARKYFFNIQDIGYLRYRLRSIVNITSRYSYIMFTYLESNRYRKSWEVDLDELKEILNCHEEQTYSQYKRFNDLILKKCHKELTEKTELRYMYEPVKKGRKVVAISFFVATIKDLYQEDNTQIEGQMSLSDFQERSNPELWSEAVEEFGFNQEQLEEIQENLVVVPDKILPQSAASYDNIYLRRYHYMRIKAAEIKRRDQENPIRNKYSYLLKMIKRDAEE